MVGESGGNLAKNSGFGAALSTSVGLLYGIGGIALLPVLLGDFAAYDYALGAVASMTMLVIGLGFALGCVAAVPLTMTVSRPIGFAAATAVAGVPGFLCWAFPSSSFPSEILLPLGLYAASAPVIVSTAAGQLTTRKFGLIPAGGALAGIIVGIVLAILFLGTAELAATALIVSSLALLVIALPIGLRALRSASKSAPTTA